MRLPTKLFLISLMLWLPSLTMSQETIAELAYDPSVCWAGKSQSAACLAMMAAHPAPDLEQVLEDGYTLSHYSFWRVGPQAVNLFDAPGGAVVRQMASGFNFVRAIDTSIDGWIQRLGGEWIRRDDAEYVRASSSTGHLLPADWQHPFAIILDKTGIYTSLSPGETGSEESGYVTRRYDLVNIFASEEDAAGNVWYLIGPRQWLRQEFVAKLAPAEKPTDVDGRWMAVDLFEQTLIAYESRKAGIRHPGFQRSAGLVDEPRCFPDLGAAGSRFDERRHRRARRLCPARRTVDDVFRREHQLARHVLAR